MRFKDPKRSNGDVFIQRALETSRSTVTDRSAAHLDSFPPFNPLALHSFPANSTIVNRKMQTLHDPHPSNQSAASKGRSKGSGKWGLRAKPRSQFDGFSGCVSLGVFLVSPAPSGEDFRPRASFCAIRVTVPLLRAFHVFSENASSFRIFNNARPFRALLAVSFILKGYYLSRFIKE